MFWLTAPGLSFALESLAKVSLVINNYKLADDTITPKTITMLEYIFKPIAVNVETLHKTFMRAVDELNQGVVDVHVGTFALKMDGLGPIYYSYKSLILSTHLTRNSLQFQVIESKINYFN
ncbi:MAG: hypothetical protein HQL70_00170 [Magnetococcales bacterium]|nr:hypothetical protein [Magnetococcales bacterium]